ncbi:hypothetical protein GA0061071_12029 [Kosakonia oryzendophytica]|uniref:Uncharacterized protein n=1 Tax=Kosakonia oryzendophytica TaxID=1005665 RepID=A0A1C4EA92_9ENTR|nr:hypothetical protein [Kosakonia oryzendophytica]AMO46473.1 Hypothetical protein AKI40_0042 [Enterobacter sp. FY-07]TDT51781.1 hypothetical protein DFO53_4289 [Enterobacter sp. AG5470]WBT58269.1 hypothetical protein O9K67_00210 [Kosakonia oryzendophytica]SCC40529.1 hypothetical protein GA0061071_12029 [Kosakonia oryzendophytica]
MGATFFIGYPQDKDLHTTLNRTESDALEALLDEALVGKYSHIHDIVMEMLVLDQISFTELSSSDFNTAIQAVRNCLHSRNEPNEWQLYQKRIWEKELEPLMQQDDRYCGE